MRGFRRLFGLHRKHGVDGREYPDPRPLEVPAYAKKPESLQEMVARMVILENHRKEIMSRTGETVEEENDFDIDGDAPEEVFSEHEQMARNIMESEEVEGGRQVRQRYKEAAERRRVGRDRDEERGRGRGRGEEDADGEREYRRRSKGDEPVERTRGHVGEDEDAGQRRRSRRVAEDR